MVIAQALPLTQEVLPQPLTALALDGRLMCVVTHQTTPLTLKVEDGQEEKILFRQQKSVHRPLIFGFP